MEIRLFQNNDLETVVKLIYNNVHEVCKEDYSDEQLDAWQPKDYNLDRWQANLNKKHCVVAVEDDVIIGFGDIGETGYIDNLYVDINHLHQGVGKALYDHIEKYAIAKGNDHIDAAASITSLSFFEKQGFKISQDVMVERRGVRMRRYVVEKKF